MADESSKRAFHGHLGFAGIVSITVLVYLLSFLFRPRKTIRILREVRAGE